VKSDQSLLEVLALLDKQKLNQLPVLRDNGNLVGLLEKASIIRLLENQDRAKAA
jgi:CBS domain-containing protein